MKQRPRAFLFMPVLMLLALLSTSSYKAVAEPKGSFDLSSVSFPLSREPAVGVNWYLNKNVKFVFDYEETSFDGGNLLTERLFLTRLQIAF